MASTYSTKCISEKLKTELLESVQNIKAGAALRFCIQDYTVTQITEKNIKKPDNGKR